jgi:hypothetical protein
MDKKWWLSIILGLTLIPAIFILSGCNRHAAPSTRVQLPGGDSISVLPSPLAYLTNSENVSSEVWLKDVRVSKGISEKQYTAPWYPAHTVNIGEPVLVVSGSIQNKHQENKEIAMYSEGYDEAGKQVAWTLDASHIVGQIGLHLENEETGQFVLHLNMAENITSIRIFANNYPITPP